jgi:hypothetical protein
VYIVQTGRSIQTRIKEHHRHTRLGHPDKSAVAEGRFNHTHLIKLQEIRILCTGSAYTPRPFYPLGRTPFITFYSIFFPSVPYPLLFCSYFLFVYPLSFNLLPVSSSSFFIVSSYLEYVSLSAPPIQPHTCLPESLHFGLVPSYGNFIFIYWFTVLLFLSPSSIGWYCSLFHTHAFVFSPGPAPGCLPWSNTKLTFFCVCFVFIYQLIVLLSLLFPSLILFVQIVSFVSVLHLLEIFHLQNVLPQSSTNDYTSPFLLATCINPIGSHYASKAYHRPHSSLINTVLGVAAFFILDL